MALQHADSNHIYDLKVSAVHGSINLAIPSSYQGVLTTTGTHSYTYYSQALSPHVRTFSDIKGVRKCFIGDFANTQFSTRLLCAFLTFHDFFAFLDKHEWHGSTIDLSSVHGSINIRYVDEIAEEKLGFFAKLFGGRS